jgi:cystathionine beta-lyase
VPAAFDFSTVQDRLTWSASKWEKYRDREVIPLWVADMDFAPLPTVQQRLAAQVAAGSFGYTSPPRELPGQLAADYASRYGWAIDPQWIVWLPGLVLGLNLAVRACTEPGQPVLTFSPVYPPFLGAPGAQGRELLDIPLKELNASGTELTIDLAALEQALAARQAEQPVRLLLLCHPHNPSGRLFNRNELQQLAALCEQYDLYVCSDEVHADLILDGKTAHTPFATVLAERSPELLARSITLHSPSKTFNIAGLGIAWAIIPDRTLRKTFRQAMQKLVPDVCCFGYSALQAVLEEGEPWRQALLAQLRENRDKVSAALDGMGLAHSHPEVTYLTWIDARGLAEKVGNPAHWLEEHGVGLSDGGPFGRPGYLRLNFALPPLLLDEALKRMRQAIDSLQG